MTALRLSSAHSVRAFGLIPHAGKEFYDSETTIERGYPYSLYFPTKVLMPLSWRGHVYFNNVAFLCVPMSAGALFSGPLHYLHWLHWDFVCK